MHGLSVKEGRNSLSLHIFLAKIINQPLTSELNTEESVNIENHEAFWKRCKDK